MVLLANSHGFATFVGLGRRPNGSTTANDRVYCPASVCLCEYVFCVWKEDKNLITFRISHCTRTLQQLWPEPGEGKPKQQQQQQQATEGFNVFLPAVAFLRENGFHAHPSVSPYLCHWREIPQGTTIHNPRASVVVCVCVSQGAINEWFLPTFCLEGDVACCQH